MAKASYLQSTFLGGEWSPYAQGRMNDRDYRAAMNVCRNTIPIEEGAAARRPGTRWLENTRNGAAGALKTFHFNQSQPYVIELTDGFLRLFQGNSLVMVEQDLVIVAISGADPAVFTTNANHGWADADQVKFLVEDIATTPGVSPLLNRTFTIDVTGAKTFTVTDAVTGEIIDGADIDAGTTIIGVRKVLEYATPYTAGAWDLVRTVQDETHVLLLHPTIKSRVLEDVTPVGGVSTLTFSTAAFIDGPYLDPPELSDTSYLTPSGLSGSITLVESGNFYSFVSTDVGRLIRLLSAPPAWVTGTNYAIGDSVTYSNNTWTALTANHGKKPDISLDDWALDPTASRWTWAEITAYTSASTVTALIKGDPLLSTSPISQFRLGVFSDTTGWPTIGTLHEGRLWLGGVVKNRFDASMSNKFLTFSPTGTDGTVADNNGISEVLRSPSGRNTILWMATDDQGVLMGTQAGEWLIRSSSLNDPLTPTSIQAHQMTTYGSEAIEPVRTGLAISFVQRYGRKAIEYSAYGEARFAGNNLSLKGKHLTASGLEELVYQQELTPCIWARTGDGQLIGCSYKRDNPVGTQPAAYSGWHRHDLGSLRTVTSIQAGPSVDGDLDSVFLITKDPDAEIYQVEVLTSLFDEDTPIEEAWFMDAAFPPSMAKIVTVTGTDYIRLYGLAPLEGKTVDVFAGGVDAGSFTVTDGMVDIPIDTADNLLTSTLLQALTDSGEDFTNIGVYVTKKATGSASVVDGLAIARYTRSGAVVTKTTFGSGIPLWDDDRFISNSSGTPGDTPIAGYRVWHLAGQGMITAKSVDTLAFPNMGDGATPFTTDILASDTKGYLYFNDSNANYGTIIKVKWSDWTVHGGVGQANSGSGVGIPPQPNGPLPGDANDLYGVPNTSNLIVGESRSKQYVFNASSVHGDWPAGDGIHVVNGTDMLWLAKGQTFGSYTGGQLCHAPGFHSGAYDFGSAFFLGARLGGLVADPLTSVGLYRLGASGTDEDDGILSSNFIGTILPSDVDALATEFTKVSFGCLDDSDGNIVWSCETDTGGKFITKMNVKTCAVMWATAVNQTPSDQSFRLSRVVGKYAFMSSQGSGPWNYYVVDTTTGALTTIVLTGTQLLSTDQFYDDYTGRIIFKGQQSSATPPTAIAPTPQGFSEDWLTLPGIASTFATGQYLAPISIGYSYTSQGQILRPISLEDTGAQTGPALGKTRRTHQFSALLHRAQGISFGTVFGKLRPAKFASAGGTSYTLLQLYSGIIQDTLENDYDYDSMLAWEITRPYPATVLTLGAFIQTQDR